MEINLYKPKSPLLQKYIDSFYTLGHLPEDGVTTYLTFPNVFTVVTAIKNVRTDFKENHLKITNSRNNKIETNFVCDFTEPVLVQYEGKTSEIVTLFKPLGINAFLEKELSKYGEGHFPSFEPFKDYKTSINDILTNENDEVKVELLEGYWLSKLNGFEHPFLFEVVSELMNEDYSQMTISELASRHNISRVTLSKQFKRHTCKTPSQFKKIVRFRKAVKQHSIKISKNQLTDIAYCVNYFDQSHMTKDFKALTGYSPKDFFAKLSKLEGENINWMFL